MKGVAIEFDHERLASILGIPGNNGICEYVKDLWEESKYIKPLEITRRRRDDDVDAPEGEAEEEEEGNQDDFDWEAVIDEAAVEGNTDQEINSMMLKIRNKTLQQRMKRFQQQFHKVQLSRKKRKLQESTPRVLLAEFLKL
ncbi:hypothetical protein Dimus_036531 [Dionaea muscipula]